MPKKPLRRATNLDAVHFLAVGFRDYIAARHLLLDGFSFQGATLASTSVEKYCKTLVALSGSLMPLHFDQLPRFIKELESREIKVLDSVDPYFLEVLSSAYRLRYYDTVPPGSAYLGFLTMQLLGELDEFIHDVERDITLTTQDGRPLLSQYRTALDNKDTKLLRENYILNGIDKQSFMERPSRGIVIGFGPEQEELVIEIAEGGLNTERYAGRMLTMGGPLETAYGSAQIGIPFKSRENLK